MEHMRQVRAERPQYNRELSPLLMEGAEQVEERWQDPVIELPILSSLCKRVVCFSLPLQQVHVAGEDLLKAPS